MKNHHVFYVVVAIALAIAGGGHLYLRYYIQSLESQNQDPSAQHISAYAPNAQSKKPMSLEELQARLFKYDTVSGNYLAGRFAQRHYDWKTAIKHIDKVVEKTEENITLLKRAMVLSMGAGHYEEAFAYARRVEELTEEPAALSTLFLSIEAFKLKDYQKASEYIAAMPEDSLSQFIMPLLYSWSSASLGTHDTRDLNQNTIHIYHAILIADFMGEHSYIEKLLTNALSAINLGVEDMVRIADIYAHINKPDEALQLYTQIQRLDPEQPGIAEKITNIKNSTDTALFERVETPEQGVGRALYDMANLLSRDYSDESALVFAHMALYLEPGDSEIILLMADLAARNERYNAAINLYGSIGAEDENFLEAKRNAADLLEEQGRHDEALAQLDQLALTHADVESKIQIGDIYRRKDDFKSAIKAYDRAENFWDEGIPEDYWHLHYLRGMAYEQSDQWEKAEEDLKAALAFQPDNPFVLNYLGYAWADQGENLEDAMQMIKKAVELRPEDGYITDSLGWVLYRMHRFEEAVPYLENAVELLPYDPIINDHLGDAYWQVGRKLEARFQWLRAKNHADDDDAELVEQIQTKLSSGLERLPADSSNTDVMEAHSEDPLSKYDL